MKKKILIITLLAITGTLMVNAYVLGKNDNATTNNQNQNQERERSQNIGGGSYVSEQRENAVSSAVQTMLQVADRNGGIGQQIRNIAQEQNKSEENTVQAMEKLQTRSRIKTFFLGSDYKNLGKVRSEMVKTKNRLEQLNRLVENAGDQGDKTELQSQIQVLEQEQAKIEEFIRSEENKFSLFGWVLKLFSR